MQILTNTPPCVIITGEFVGIVDNGRPRRLVDILFALIFTTYELIDDADAENFDGTV